MRKIICVAGLWGAGKSTFLNQVNHKYSDIINIRCIKNYPLDKKVRRNRGLQKITIEELNFYYDYLKTIWLSIINSELRKVSDRILIYEMSPLIMYEFRRIFSNIFYIDTPPHICIHRLSKRENLPLTFAQHLIKIQLETVPSKEKSFWHNVICSSDIEVINGKTMRLLDDHIQKNLMEQRI